MLASSHWATQKMSVAKQQGISYCSVSRIAQKIAEKFRLFETPGPSTRNETGNRQSNSDLIKKRHGLLFSSARKCNGAVC